MYNGVNSLRAFGKCRLDLEKKYLWCEDALVSLPPKSVELLCLLVERQGDIVTKEEIWHDVWHDSFVEETNLTHNIYLLRKTFRNLGENDLIQTVPRRGYRFTGIVTEAEGSEFTIEKHALTRTVIEISQRSAVSELFARKRLAVILTLAVTAVSAVLGFSAYQGRVAGSSAPGIRSIAVLPFSEIDQTVNDKHFGLGLADVLITRLSNVREIQVRPTSAVLAYENSREDSISAGRKLSVDAVLEGTIHKSAGQVRVTARLIRVGDGSPIWAGQFERTASDEFRLQNEIALKVVDALAVNLAEPEKLALTKRFTENSDAYQLYQKGRYEWNKRNWAAMIEAQRLFRNAIEIDPNFALAHAGLADTLVIGSNFEETAIAIGRALELDPNLAEAHATKGFDLLFHAWNWPAAEEAFKRSIELNPNYATAHHWYAQLLTIQGRHDEAKSEMRQALEIDPLSHNFLADLGQIYYFNREYKEAEQYCRRALEIYPDFIFAHEYLHDIYLKTGEYDKAVEAQMSAQRVHSSFPNNSVDQMAKVEKAQDLLRSKYRNGDIRAFIKALIGDSSDPSGSYVLATRYAFLSDKKSALERLEFAQKNSGFLAVFVKADPVFDDLRSEPRYIEVLRKMNL